MTDVEEGDPLTKPTNPGASVGLDLKYAVTPALTVTATINPDFGQVEADPAAVNLEAFELFFNERRPFFVEGSGIFRFNIDCNDGECTGLLYSRRIGRVPQVEPDVADDEYIEGPDAVTILGAAKLAGRIGAFSVGALERRSRRRSTRPSPRGSSRTETVIEPLTGFNLMRARREFANRSNLGLMLTSTTRQLTADTQLPRRAGRSPAAWTTTGGIGERYSLSGFWAGSRISGDPEAMTRVQENAVHYYQRPDADYVELDPNATSLSGHAGSVNRQQDRRREGALQRQLRLQEPRLRDQRPRLPAPRRRAHDEPLGAVARPGAGQVQAPVHGELQPVGRLELRRRQPVQRRQRQHALVVAEQLARRLRRERERRRPARPGDARRAGRAQQPDAGRLALHRVRRPARGVPRLQRLRRRRRPGIAAGRGQPEGQLAADARACASRPGCASAATPTTRSGWRTSTTTTARRTTCSGGCSSAPWR